MTMRVIKMVTQLRAEDAHTLIEFLDAVRETLMQTYGREIRAMLHEASTQNTGGTQENEPL